MKILLIVELISNFILNLYLIFCISYLCELKKVIRDEICIFYNFVFGFNTIFIFCVAQGYVPEIFGINQLTRIFYIIGGSLHLIFLNIRITICIYKIMGVK